MLKESNFMVSHINYQNKKNTEKTIKTADLKSNPFLKVTGDSSNKNQTVKFDFNQAILSDIKSTIELPSDIKLYDISNLKGIKFKSYLNMHMNRAVLIFYSTTGEDNIIIWIHLVFNSLIIPKDEKDWIYRLRISNCVVSDIKYQKNTERVETIDLKSKPSLKVDESMDNQNLTVNFDFNKELDSDEKWTIMPSGVNFDEIDKDLQKIKFKAEFSHTNSVPVLTLDSTAGEEITIWIHFLNKFIIKKESPVWINMFKRSMKTLRHINTAKVILKL